MHTAVRRGIIDVNSAVIIRNPAVGEQHVGDIANTFRTLRSHEVTPRFGNHSGRVTEVSHVKVKNITQSCRTPSHAVGKMKPSFRCLYGMWPLTVLNLLDGMVVSAVSYTHLRAHETRH